MLVSYMGAQPQKLPQEHKGKSEAELNTLGFVICPEKPTLAPGQKAIWVNNAWTVEDPTPSELAIKWQAVKNQRDRLLAQSDQWVVDFVGKGQAVPLAIKEYRTALKEIENQPSPFGLTLPNAPDAPYEMEFTAENLPTADAVNEERDRRLVMDFEFQGVMFQRDPKSMSRITGAAALAGFAMGQGAVAGNYFWHGGANPFTWIASDNSLIQMDAPTTFAFGQAAAAVETTIIFAAKALREMDPIPADYTDDQYWP